MEAAAVYLATRLPDTSSASAVFLLAGSGHVDSAGMRVHLLRPWTLFVRLFPTQRRALRWALGVDAVEGERAPTAIPPPLPGNRLRVFFPSSERVVDLDDPMSCCSFLLDLHADKSAMGVMVRPFALTHSTPVAVPAPVTAAAILRRRKRGRGPGADDGGAGGSARRASAGGSVGAGPSAARPSTRGGSEAALHGLGATAACWTSPKGPTSKRRVVWPRTDKSGGLRQVFSPVATLPPDLYLPESLPQDTLRVCKLLCAHKGVFLTGPPGSGKTHLVRRVIGALRAAAVTVAVCASSGVAATVVGGVTAHAWLGFVHGHADVYTDLGVVLAHVIPPAAKTRMRAAMVMVMDEIGTSSADFVARLDLVLQAVRESPLPFGGITTLFAGDFLQLPPPNGSFAFTCAVWSQVFGHRAVVLSSNWRHVNDPVLLGLIVRLRVGAHTTADLELLASRKVETPPATAVWLTTHTHMALEKNEEELCNLEGPDEVFLAVDKALASYLSHEKATVLLNDCVKVPSRVVLRVGAAVIVPSSCLTRRGIPSGTRGVVVTFSAVGGKRYPVVRFALSSGQRRTMLVTPITITVVALDGHSDGASRTQVPLVLGWASTIHRAQGWTVPEVAVDLKGAFAAGQVLSAVSRAPRLSSIYLVSFDSDQIIVDQLAASFHASLVSL